MSSMDLYEDGFPHSTREGWERGCRGSACPGKLDYGFSCTEAQVRYAGDYAYRRLVDGGATPEDVAAADVLSSAAAVAARKALKAEKAAKVAAPKPRPVSKPTVQPLSPDVLAQLEEVEASIAAPRKPGGQPKPITHGTQYGYQKGCRDGAACPKGENGMSCLDATRAYHQEYTARRKANGGVSLGQRNARDQDVAQAPDFSAVVAERDARIVELESRLAEVRAAWAVVQRVLGATS